MAFDIRVSGEHAKIVLSGDVDLQTTADLKAEIQGISDVTRLEIEAANVSYIDSSGVAVLLLARQHCAQNNITLSMPAVSEAVNRVLQIAKLDAMLPIGEVVGAADTGLMGLGLGVGGDEASGPADDDDDLVNALLADDAQADDAQDATADAEQDAGFEGLDIRNVDFSQPAEAAAETQTDQDDSDADGDGTNGPILPGTFS